MVDVYGKLVGKYTKYIHGSYGVRYTLFENQHGTSRLEKKISVFKGLLLGGLFHVLRCLDKLGRNGTFVATCMNLFFPIYN